MSVIQCKMIVSYDLCAQCGGWCEAAISLGRNRMGHFSGNIAALSFGRLYTFMYVTEEASMIGALLAMCWSVMF